MYESIVGNISLYDLLLPKVELKKRLGSSTKVPLTVSLVTPSGVYIELPHSSNTVNPNLKYNKSIISNCSLLLILIRTVAFFNEPRFNVLISALIIPGIGEYPYVP